MAEIKFEGEALEAVKQVLPEIDFSGVEGDITIDTINKLKGEKLVTRDVHDREIASAVGRITGEGQTIFGRILGEEAKGKKYKELLPELEKKFAGFTERITELEKGNKSDLTEKERRELADLKKLVQDQEATIATKTSELEKVQKDVEDRVSGILLTNEINSIYERMPWVDNVSKYAKDGLRASADHKYTFKKDGERILVYDKEGGVVKNSAGTGQMEVKDLFESLANGDSLLKKNGAVNPMGTPPQGGVGKVPLTPKQQAHWEKMQKNAKGEA